MSESENWYNHLGNILAISIKLKHLHLLHPTAPLLGIYSVKSVNIISKSAHFRIFLLVKTPKQFQNHCYMSNRIYIEMEINELKPCSKTVECCKCNVDQKEVDSKKCLLHDPSYIKFNKQAKFEKGI